MRSLLLVFPAVFLVACGGATATSAPPVTPASQTTAPSASATPPPLPPPDPWAVRGDLRKEPPSLLAQPAPELTLVTLPPMSQAIAKLPDECAAFVKRKATKAPACADATAALAALDGAMAKTDAAERDAALAGLESCAGMPTGLVRALRTDLAPPACGDALAGPLVAKPPKTITGAVYATLLGQALAGRLARLGDGAPAMTGGPFDKDHVLAYIKTTLGPWLVAQANAIEELSLAGAKLTSYGRAIAAIEAGMADLRLVDAARNVPLPEEFLKDTELREIYVSALEGALDPRKTRGRDAALVALGDFAAVGALTDPRVERARTLLSKIYGGRRIKALDVLTLPAIGDAPAATVEQRLGATLPTFYATALFDPKKTPDAELLRALMHRGVPAPVRANLATATPQELRPLLARARLDLGRLYWRSFDFDEVAALTNDASKTATSATPESLELALALALRKGPRNAADMIQRAPIESLGVGEVGALDVLASGTGAVADDAAWAAAVLREIAAPSSADEAYWLDVAKRFHDAAKRSGPFAAEAEKRATNAESIAANIRGGGSAPKP